MADATTTEYDTPEAAQQLIAMDFPEVESEVAFLGTDGELAAEQQSRGAAREEGEEGGAALELVRAERALVRVEPGVAGAAEPAAEEAAADGEEPAAPRAEVPVFYPHTQRRSRGSRSKASMAFDKTELEDEPLRSNKSPEAGAEQNTMGNEK